MHKKDYIQIAQVIRELDMPPTTRWKLIAELSSMFKRDNSAFDKERFRRACDPACD